MAKNRAGYTDAGQPIGSQGEPDKAALAAVEEANKAIDLAKELPALEAEQSAEGVQEVMPGSVPATNHAAPTLKEMAADPEVVRTLLNTAAQDPEMRQMLNIQPGVGPPSGYYHRNYQAETALHVPGGLEVAHEPGYRPKAPAKIKMYLAADGTPTDYLAAQVPPDRRGSIKAAALGTDGQPLLTEGYKRFLDARMAGGRLDSKVQMDIAVGQTNAGDDSHTLIDPVSGQAADFADGGIDIRTETTVDA